jgi:hypothetical protein
MVQLYLFLIFLKKKLIYLQIKILKSYKTLKFKFFSIHSRRDGEDVEEVNSKLRCGGSKLKIDPIYL